MIDRKVFFSINLVKWYRVWRNSFSPIKRVFFPGVLGSVDFCERVRTGRAGWFRVGLYVRGIANEGDGEGEKGAGLGRLSEGACGS